MSRSEEVAVTESVVHGVDHVYVPLSDARRTGC